MKTIPFVKATIIKVFSFFIIVAFFSSCGKKEHKNESAFKKEALTKNKQQSNKEQIEASFFIATANVSNTIISKSQIAQKRSESPIQELSKKIENQQNQLLQNVSEMANKKLIMITDIDAIHKRDLYESVDTSDTSFSKTYLNSIEESLTEQIELLEKVSTETNDEKILKLVLEFLPAQYELLRETEKTKTEY